MSKNKHMFSYSTSTVWQILPVIIAAYRQILPVLRVNPTQYQGLYAGTIPAIYGVSFCHLEPTK